MTPTRTAIEDSFRAWLAEWERAGCGGVACDVALLAAIAHCSSGALEIARDSAGVLRKCGSDIYAAIETVKR